MPSSIAIAQYLPQTLLTAGFALLSFIVLMSIRSKFKRRARAMNPKKFIQEVRSQAVGDKLSDQFAVPSLTDAHDEPSQDGDHIVSKAQSPIRSSSGTSESLTEASARLDLASQTLLELEATARRVIAQLDTRSAVLANLIGRADERIQTLEEHANSVSLPVASISPAKADTQEHQHETPIESSTADESVSLNGSANSTANRLTELLEQARFAEHYVPRFPVKPSVQAMSPSSLDNPKAKGTVEVTPVPQQAVSQSSVVDRLADSIYELADRGMSSISIAQDLDEQVGKIELILALRPS